MTVRADVSAWTIEDVAAFIALIREKGGEVSVPIRETNNGGYEFDIYRPQDSTEGWGLRMMKRFIREREERQG